ncbi:hypothetical protein [Kitasatospora sp. NPDC127116]|uniref:hypothetical protein n=1 Tax=Kitasatospora sp. NPDC127116 TaxID=3345367 RepID=UPI003626158E
MNAIEQQLAAAEMESARLARDFVDTVDDPAKRRRLADQIRAVGAEISHLRALLPA